MNDLLRWAIEQLRKSGVETPQLDAEVLLAYVLKRDRLRLYVEPEINIDRVQELRYRELISKRLERMPVAYITGHKEFMSLDFKVDQSVLIPRPETEILVEVVCKQGKAVSRVLEIGTGSGAIAVSLAKYNPEWRILAIDISMSAIRIAHENACRHEVAKRISFAQTNLFDAISFHGKFDWIVSNPPYIPTADLAKLSDEIRKYEPIIALDGGADGLTVIRHIIEDAHEFLKPDGQLAIEIGYGQSEMVRGIADEMGQYSDCSMIDDYRGIPRVFCCRLRAESRESIFRR